MLTYLIDIPTKTVHLLGPPPASAEEFEQLVRAVIADPEFAPGFGFLRDRRGHGPPPEAIIRSTAEVLKRIQGLPTSKCAFVVASAGNFAMMQMAQALSADTWIEFGIFHLLHKAKHWLHEPLMSKAEMEKISTSWNTDFRP